MNENPQDLSKGTNDDSSSLLGEAQEDIQPQNQPPQEKEDCCSYIQRKRKMPPFLTKEEIDQLINMQSTSNLSHEHKISIYFPPNPSYHIDENRFIDQFEEKQSDSPICTVGNINYIDDSPRFDQYVDCCSGFDTRVYEITRAQRVWSTL